MLAAKRDSSSSLPAPSQPPVNIFFSPDMIGKLNGNTGASLQAAKANVNTGVGRTPLIPHTHVSGTDMPIAQFCKTYALDARILQVLTNKGYMKMNTFCYITLQELQEIGLKRGNIASLRYAIELWAVAQ
jgi:hypothetical protein